MLALGTTRMPQRAIAWNPSAPLNRGLIGWWLMQADVFTGTRVPSMVPRTILHGTKVGMSPVAADAGMHPTTRPGGFGELRFNRSTAYATIPDSAYWEFAGNFTLAWWFKMAATSSSLAAQQYLLYKNSGVSPWFSLQASVTTADQLYCAFHNTTPTYADISTTLTLSAKVWYHCVITRVGTALAAYVNGVNVTSGSPTLSGALLNATALFGLGGNSLDSTLGGAMDDLRLYPARGLAADEVRELYWASLGGYRRELVWGGVPMVTLSTAPTAYALAGDAGSLDLTGTATTPDVVLPAASAGLALAGAPMTPRATRLLVASPGSFALTGTLSVPRVTLAATSGAVVLTGTPSIPRLTLGATPGTVSLAGTATTAAVMLPGDAGILTLTGTAAPLQATRRLTADAGSLTLTMPSDFGLLSAEGQWYALTMDGMVPTLTPGPTPGAPLDWLTVQDETGGTWYVTSAAATLVVSQTPPGAGTGRTERFTLLDSQGNSWILSVHSGTQALVATPGQVFSAASAGVALTGTAALLRRARRLASAAGSVTLSGTASQPRVTLAAAPASTALLGTAAALRLTLLASAGACTLTGTATALRTLRRLPAVSDSVTLGGTAALPRLSLPASPGPVGLAGTASTPRVLVPAAAGSVTLTGQAAALLYGQAVELLAETGSVLLAGTSATLRTVRRLPAAPATVATTGLVTVPRLTLPAVGGSVTFTGQAAALLYGEALALLAAPGTVLLTGPSVGLRHVSRLSASAGLLTLTGTAAALLTGQALLLPAASGSVALAGTAAQMRRLRRLLAVGGSVALTGGTATLVLGSHPQLAAVAGSVTFSGTAAMLQHSHRLVATGGALSLTGTASSPRLLLTASPGAYAVSGTAVTLQRSHRVTAAAGAVSLVGTAITPRVVLGATAGTLALTGDAATLRYGQRLTLPVDAGAVLVAGTAATMHYGVRHFLDAAAGPLLLAGLPAVLRLRLGAGSGLLTVLGSTVVTSRTRALPALPGRVDLTVPSVHFWWSPQMRRRVVYPTEVHIVAPDGTILYVYSLRRLPQVRSYAYVI